MNLSDSYLKSIINQEFGGWPILTNIENTLSTTELITRLFKYNVNPLFYVYVYSDPKNTNVRRITVI